MVKCWQAMHMHSRSDHANLEHVSQRIAILEHMLQRVTITATQIAKSYYLIGGESRGILGNFGEFWGR